MRPQAEHAFAFVAFLVAIIIVFAIVASEVPVKDYPATPVNVDVRKSRVLIPRTVDEKRALRDALEEAQTRVDKTNRVIYIIFGDIELTHEEYVSLCLQVQQNRGN